MTITAFDPEDDLIVVKRDFRIHAHDLHEDDGVHGLLGLSFLRNLDDEVRSRDGRLRAELAAAR